MIWYKHTTVTLNVDIDELTPMCRRVSCSGYRGTVCKVRCNEYNHCRRRMLCGRCQKRRMTSMEQATKHARSEYEKNIKKISCLIILLWDSSQNEVVIKNPQKKKK